MSDEDDRQTNSNKNNRRLLTIKLKLQQLTREKAKYNAEKLTQDIDFLQSEIGHLSHAISDINKEINTYIYEKRILNAKITILRSSPGLRYPNLEIALRDKIHYENELKKSNKSDVYRELAQRKIKSIIDALPQLEKQNEYNQQFQKAEDAQIAAQNRREKLQENLNTKSRKQAETRLLLVNSKTKIIELEEEIKNLRLERETILKTTNEKKKHHNSFNQSLSTPEQQDALEYEKRQYNEQLEKIHLLLKYFHEKMSEHNLSINDTSSSSSFELKSPSNHQSITHSDEQTILTSYMNEYDYDNNQSNIAIAMKLSLSINFTQSDTNLPTTNEIIHSPCYQQSSTEYKKIPLDIVGKYGRITKKKEHQQQQSTHGKKNKKNFGIKHSSQMINLYNDIRKSSNNSDTLPYMPM